MPFFAFSKQFSANPYMCRGHRGPASSIFRVEGDRICFGPPINFWPNAFEIPASSGKDITIQVLTYHLRKIARLVAHDRTFKVLSPPNFHDLPTPLYTYLVFRLSVQSVSPLIGIDR